MTISELMKELQAALAAGASEHTPVLPSNRIMRESFAGVALVQRNGWIEEVVLETSLDRKILDNAGRFTAPLPPILTSDL